MAHRGKLVLIIAALAATLALGAGCQRHGGGKITDLFVSNLRYVIDDTRETVHVYGCLANAGPGRFREVELQIMLVSKSESSRGENSVVLQKIQPQEKRLFAVDVTSHGRVSGVDVKIRDPNAR